MPTLLNFDLIINLVLESLYYRNFNNYFCTKDKESAHVNNVKMTVF